MAKRGAALPSALQTNPELRAGRRDMCERSMESVDHTAIGETATERLQRPPWPRRSAGLLTCGGVLGASVTTGAMLLRAGNDHVPWVCITVIICLLIVAVGAGWAAAWRAAGRGGPADLRRLLLIQLIFNDVEYHGTGKVPPESIIPYELRPPPPGKPNQPLKVCRRTGPGDQAGRRLGGTRRPHGRSESRPR